MSPPHDFASDNHAGVHPDVLAAIADVNEGHAASYGGDACTARAEDLFRRHFGSHAEAFIVFNGSGANVACLDLALRPHEAVICTETAHMNVDECGAPERLAGAKLLHRPKPSTASSPPTTSRRWEARRGDEHSAQPRVVSISQATELGTIYTLHEVAAIAERAHAMDLLLHVDGARIANAAASLDLSLAAITTEAGVDLLSFGGTKNGLMFGEAMVILRPELAPHAKFVRKQLLQLNSKMRFCAAQFEALLSENLWLYNARNANAMAQRLRDAVRGHRWRRGRPSRRGERRLRTTRPRRHRPPPGVLGGRAPLLHLGRGAEHRQVDVRLGHHRRRRGRIRRCRAGSSRRPELI